MGKTHRKNRESGDVTWEELDDFIAGAFRNNKEAKRKRERDLTREYDPEEEEDEAYGSFQKIGRRKCPRTTF